MTEYVEEEPKTVTVWVDNNGDFCSSKEEALRKNFDLELRYNIETLVYPEGGYHQVVELLDLLKLLAEKRSDLLLKLVEQTEAKKDLTKPLGESK